MVFYRSPMKLSTYLVRAKPYPIGRIMGSKVCGKKQFKVSVNVFVTDNFLIQLLEKHIESTITFIVTINAWFIFLRASAVVNNVWETTKEFRFRWNKYKYNDQKYTWNDDCFQEYWFRYFHREIILVSFKTSR